MSSVQQQPQGETTTESTSVLDAAIAATEKNLTLTEKAAASMGVPAESLLTILRGVWTTSKDEPDLTQADMFVGIGIVAKYDLDPIAREIFVTKSKGKLITIIGIDGWIKILDRTDHYDGYEMEIHEDENGVIDYVDATIHSKVRKHPSTYRAFRSEYSKLSGFMYQKIPIHMLRLFALRHAARLFVPLGGTVMTQEEADAIIDGKATSTGSRVERVELPEVTAEPSPELTDAEQFDRDVPENGKTGESFQLKGGDK